MDEILKGILISDHPEPLKDKLIQKIVLQAEAQQESKRVQSVLELSISWSLHGTNRFEIHSGIRVYSEWAKHNVSVVENFFTEEYLTKLMTQRYENSHVPLIIFDKTLTILDGTSSYHLLSETFGKLCLDFMAVNFTLECLYILLQILSKFKECVPHKRIIDLCNIIIDIVSNTEITTDCSDVFNLVKKINFIADFLSRTWQGESSLIIEENLFRLFKIISSPHTQPSQCLAAIMSSFPLSMVGETINLTVMPNIEEIQIHCALIRMISWLQWPTSQNIDIWIIDIFNDLEFAKRYDTLMKVTENNIEYLFISLKIVLCRHSAFKILSHLLLRCQHDPAPFHKIIKRFPEVFQCLKDEKSHSSKQCMKELSELIHIQIYIHAGFPELYDPILDLITENSAPELTFIRAVIEKYSSKCWGSASNVVVSRELKDQLLMSPTKRLGLYNLSNTCYMNCIIQVLFLLDEFRRELLSLASNEDQILYEMQRLFSFLLGSKRPAISPKSFYKVSNPSCFNVYEQQDCMEFLSFLIQKLDEEQAVTNPSEPPKEPLGQYFTGKTRNLVHCRKCSETFVQSKDTFTTINLAFPSDEQSVYKLSSLLEYYFQAEEMTGNNKINCVFCKSFQNGRRWVEIVDAPQYLKLTLMRFSYDSILHKKVKIMNKVKYPIELSIPYVDGKTNCKSMLVYVLCSVIVHSGSSSECGHYYCFGRHSSVVNVNSTQPGDILKDEWYLFNDERVSFTDFMSAHKLSKYPQDTPYLLVYRLVDNKLQDTASELQETNNELDEKFIPRKFKSEIRRDNMAYRKNYAS